MVLTMLTYLRFAVMVLSLFDQIALEHILLVIRNPETRTQNSETSHQHSVLLRRLCEILDTVYHSGFRVPLS
jgi:hypothetical protein